MMIIDKVSIGGDRARSEPAGVSPFDREVLDRRAKIESINPFWIFGLSVFKISIHKSVW